MDFQTAFDRLIGHEGEYSDDPKDPGNWTGGRVGSGFLRGTKFGISASAYPNEDIKGLTRERAKFLYHRDFWSKISADTLPDGVAFQLFDFAVNSGIQTAIRYFQRSLGVADDGIWGPHSQAAADATSETDMILNLNAERLDYMTRLSNWQDHGRGWARRIAKNLRYGAMDS